MKLLAIVLLMTSLCGIFVAPVNGLSCYQCSWTDTACNTEKLATDTKKVTCGAAARRVVRQDPPAATEAPAAADAAAAGAETTAAGAEGGAAPAGGATTPGAAGAGAEAAGDYFCYRVLVKANDSSPVTVDRGCKKTDATEDCLTPALDKTLYPKGTVEKCTTCNKDNCNENVGISLKSNALLIQCALLSATMIAKMFFQTKL